MRKKLSAGIDVYKRQLYDQSRKAELTACLQQQASAKSGLEECEMAWLEAQEQLEQMLLEGQSN